ncbi:MAG: hypothetical protein A2538_01985 [Candidatus Magasanikbacteria bacterium RIFOXYD2_FULL_41_14]|uniref:Shikimate kinase n=1 Tax=Candidatus Magasanikbacteria bacterium RIFOXYD2_FULL_41_14 TaxID=1798709 RepID=A0A1F6PD23_9BACT|nr:MAG: hypothetical protein A2538_01985 [Candidatus Magasanikbacteria bacterium RIFOXYD2_FULL_41_14]
MSHTLLIGFKNVGKSSVARELAKVLGCDFVDTDRVLEEHFAELSGEKLSCREIMRLEGEEKFRALEHEALRATLARPESVVVAVGGGAPLQKNNEELLRDHTIVHVTAPKGAVYERIMMNGWPAFFPRDVEPYVAFTRIWEERLPQYERLAQITVNNGETLSKAVDELIINMAKKV